MIDVFTSDLRERGNPFSCHCERLKGAWQSRKIKEKITLVYFSRQKVVCKDVLPESSLVYPPLNKLCKD